MTRDTTEGSEPTVLFEQVLQDLNKPEANAVPQRVSGFRDWWVPMVEPVLPHVDAAEDPGGRDDRCR